MEITELVLYLFSTVLIINASALPLLRVFFARLNDFHLICVNFLLAHDTVQLAIYKLLLSRYEKYAFFTVGAYLLLCKRVSLFLIFLDNGCGYVEYCRKSGRARYLHNNYYNTRLCIIIL